LLLGEPAQLGTGLRVGDRRGGQLGEVGQPRLGVRGEGLLAGARYHDAPEAAFHADRHSDRRAVLPVASDIGERARGGAVVIDPGWPSCPEYLRVDVLAFRFEPQADSERAARVAPGPATYDRDQAVCV